MTAFPESVEIIRAAALAADEKKAENIVAFDVSDSLAITDAFMVASAPNERQVSAVVDAIEDKLIQEHKVKPLRREGRGEGRWVLLDFGDIVIHVLHDEDRAFYALERLWGDSPKISLNLPEQAATSNADAAPGTSHAE
ncbi:ribosome silencing factor [Kocuria carniphila]|uniref:Ribosomal silencing factor RsfS n=1 Tax=Kocuria carniphila TaxID=262208 RepID=A0ABV3UYE6_9MICC|nr:ribosome silencing factor [Kocuria carniphila]MCT1802750.1 ribosome silencing factor [Kocuria carniphila]PZP30543.1 MAG: ribosome silencing factor [Kocuria rhizophila]